MGVVGKWGLGWLGQNKQDSGWKPAPDKSIGLDFLLGVWEGRNISGSSADGTDISLTNLSQFYLNLHMAD